MKTPEHLVALAESDEASMPETATVKENGTQVRKQTDWYWTRQHRAGSLIDKACPQEQDGTVWRCYFSTHSYRKNISETLPEAFKDIIPSAESFNKEVYQRRDFWRIRPSLQTHHILVGVSGGLGPEVYVSRRAPLGHSTRNTEREILLLNSYF